MNKHTPTTGQVETGFALYLYDHENIVIGAGRDRFKAWLAEHDAQVRQEAKAQALRQAAQSPRLGDAVRYAVKHDGYASAARRSFENYLLQEANRADQLEENK